MSDVASGDDNDSNDKGSVPAAKATILGVWQFAGWLMGTIVGLIVTPPPGGTWGRLVQFVAAVGAGLLLMLVTRWRSLLLWWMMTLLFLVLSVGAYLQYTSRTQSWTFTYRDETYVVGSDLLDDVQVYVDDRGGSVTPAQLMAAFEGDPGNIWIRDSIDARTMLLGFWYMLCAPLFACTLVSLACGIAASSRDRAGFQVEASADYDQEKLPR